VVPNLWAAGILPSSLHIHILYAYNIIYFAFPLLHFKCLYL
jgi:hypothetical protein